MLIASKWMPIVEIVLPTCQRWCAFKHHGAVMLKNVRPKDLTDKISFGLTKMNISATHSIVRTDKIFKINPNDCHVQKDFDISNGDS